jgi:hypothetical protein
MEECQLHPFERNRYFYGKLLSAGDFQTEQSYMNEKRQLINRLIHGWGVVCGLQVKPVACPEGIRIAPGVALDSQGREILVNRDVIIRKNEIVSCQVDKQGQKESRSLYVCLQYVECEKDPVPALNPLTCQESCEHTHIVEGFKIEIRHDVCLPPVESCTTWEKKQTETGIEAFVAKKLEDCPGCSKCDCVVLAKITFQPRGKIHIHHTIRQYVYNNRLLYDLLFCMEKRIEKLEASLLENDRAPANGEG